MIEDKMRSVADNNQAGKTVPGSSNKKLFARCSYCPELRIYWVKLEGEPEDRFFRADQMLDLYPKLVSQGREQEFHVLVKIAVRARCRPHKIVMVYGSDMMLSPGDLATTEVEFVEPVFGEDPFEMDDESKCSA